MSTEDGATRLVHSKDLARQLHLSTGTIRAYARTGKIRPRRVTPGGHRLYDAEQVQRQLEQPPADKRTTPPETSDAMRQINDVVTLGDTFSDEAVAVTYGLPDQPMAIEAAALLGAPPNDEPTPTAPTVMGRLRSWAGPVVSTDRQTSA